jgi:hypothetical protein
VPLSVALICVWCGVGVCERAGDGGVRHCCLHPGHASMNEGARIVLH